MLNRKKGKKTDTWIAQRVIDKGIGYRQPPVRDDDAALVNEDDDGEDDVNVGSIVNRCDADSIIGDADSMIGDAVHVNDDDDDDDEVDR